MKSLCVLAVAVAAVATSPGCLSYCNILNSGWKIARRSDCNCFTPPKTLQGETKYENDLKSILLPLKSEPNREPVDKELHKNEDYRIRRAGNNKFSEVEQNKMKTSDDGEIPINIVHNSSINSKSLDEKFNNTHINDSDLSDCIDLHISIIIRKHKNKNYANLEPKSLEQNVNLSDLEINTEIKSKCNQITTIIERSVEVIKEHQQLNNKKKNVIVNIDTDPASEMTDKITPVIKADEEIDTISTSPYDDYYTNMNTTNNTLILDNKKLNDSNLSILDNNILEETTDKYNNFKDLNDSVVMEDSNTTDMSRNSFVNNTSMKLKNIHKLKDNNNNLPYSNIELRKNILNDELVTRKSQNLITFPKTTQNKLTVDYSNNGKESASKTFITNSDKNVATKTINSNESNSSFRNRYEETEVPVVSIITREYKNNTISSIINGTEVLPNSDFEEDTIININKIENTSHINNSKNVAPDSEIQSKSDDSTPFASEKQTFVNTSPTINGRFYFVYRQKSIPGRFVQTPDGHLQLSLDLETICKELLLKGKENSLLISTLCQCLS